VPLSDIGMQRGYAVFDFIRTFSGKPFLFGEHLARFERSAKDLGLRIPYSRKFIKNIIDKLLKKNGFKESIIKVWITGGDLSGSLNFDPRHCRFFVTINELHELPAKYFINGVKLITTEFQRAMPTSKTIDYLIGVKEQRRCDKAGAFEILFKSNGIVTESATSNFFIVKGNTIVTPKKNILFGITRNFVINLAKKKYKVIERDIKYAELRQADEAFLTATKKDILPIVKIDNIKIGNGKVGPKTKYLMDQYFKYVHKHYDPSRA
jgi:branched-chain amino acid aminotransferase